MRSREVFPSCEICGAVVRRTLMHLHHAWHHDSTSGPAGFSGTADAAELEDEARSAST